MVAFPRGRGRLAWLLLAGLLAVAADGARSQAAGGPGALGAAEARVGEVRFAQGAALAQSPGQGPRAMGRGLVLHEGDELDVAQGGLAIVHMDDGTQMTLRPGTRLVVQRWRWQPEASDNAGVLSLLRGGLRMLSGLVAHQGPDALAVRTPVATIGIRGTDFDARLCDGGGRECADSPGSAAVPRPAAIRASARVVQARGALTATDAQGRSHRLVVGSSLYPGDMLDSGPDSQAVLAFRDESRLSVGASTRLRLDDFVYDPAQPAEGRFFLSLLRGTLRALTGLVARANPRQVLFSTAVVTVGVRGTGLDLACFGTCAGEPAGPEGERFKVCTWRGALDITEPGRQGLERLEPGACAQVDAGGLRRTATVLELPLPRPDTIPVPDAVFAQAPLPETPQGLFVRVREGHVALLPAGGSGPAVDLGNGEVGHADAGVAERLADQPLLFDRPTPSPASPTPGLLQGLGLPAQGGMCR